MAAVTVTNNGISLLPTFSLGKPAGFFEMTLSKNKFSFEPQIRYALSGKPWSYIFWVRYKLLNNDKFIINMGAHPALVFREIAVSTNGVVRNYMAGQRYIAGDFAPNYRVTKNTTVGIYYLTSAGMDKGTVGRTHFLTFNSNIGNVKLPGKLLLRFIPQIYYLKMDRNDGYYLTTNTILSRKGFPVTLSAVTNHTFTSEIPNSKPFNWNVSLTWMVNKKYVLADPE
ncbi:MAG: hypothetical protein FJZ78_11595 [Bacteroidetes bacterium]|nr:hypothetical protein [Bacteroidota bacterium]